MSGRTTMFAAALAVALSLPVLPPPVQAAHPDTLIPRKDIFGNPTRSLPMISPDGKSIAFIAPRDGVLNVFVAPRGNVHAAKPVTADRKRGIRRYFWAQNSQQIIYTQDEGGDENWRIHLVDIAIMGGSYGGCATLVGMTFTPETFACGVDIVGPSNLVTLIESFPAYWQPFLEASWYRRVGDPRTDEGKTSLLARSPITKVDRIKRPLLIGQGANDPRVTRKESDQIVAAMNARTIPVTYAIYADEGHGFARPENRISFFAIAENFLATCLGGRGEPIGDDAKGAALTVPEGANYVPGLREAIAAQPQ